MPLPVSTLPITRRTTNLTFLPSAMVCPQVALPPTRTRCRNGGCRTPNRCQSGRAYGIPCPTTGPPLAPLVDLTRLLEAGLEGDPATAALQDLDHSLSWAELDRQVERLARAYQRLGLRRGDRLASLIPNRVGLVVHYLAGLRSGLVLTPLNYRHGPPASASTNASA